MEVTLIVVTLVSIALAIAMGILTWRLLQEERLRSDARVAALEQGLAETLQDAYVTQVAARKSPRGARTERRMRAERSLHARRHRLARPLPPSAAKPAATSRAADRPVETRAFAARASDDVAGADDTAADE